MKPTYKIHKAYLVDNCLHGLSDKDDARFPESSWITTSKVVLRDGDFVETKNSNYQVESWYVA